MNPAPTFNQFLASIPVQGPKITITFEDRMTFQEALSRLRNPPPYILGGDSRLLAMAEQIEENRKTIEAMKEHVHWQDMPMGTTGTPVFQEQP